MGPWNWRWTKLGNFQFWGNLNLWNFRFFFKRGCHKSDVFFCKGKGHLKKMFPRWNWRFQMFPFQRWSDWLHRAAENPIRGLFQKQKLGHHLLQPGGKLWILRWSLTFFCLNMQLNWGPKGPKRLGPHICGWMTLYYEFMDNLYLWIDCAESCLST